MRKLKLRKLEKCLYMSKLQVNLLFDVYYEVKIKARFWCRKSYAGVEVQFHYFLNSKLSGAIVQPHVPADLPPGKYSRILIDLGVG